MELDRYSVKALTSRILDIDPTGPILEVATELPLLFRELTAAVGDTEASLRFGRALAVAVATPRW